MIWATVSSQSCFCWLYRASPSLVAKNIINLILVLTIWWYSRIESSLVLLEEGVCYDQCRLWWTVAGLGALSVTVHAWDLLREVTFIFITSTLVWSQVNSRKGTQLHPSTENGLKIYWAWLCPSEQDPVSSLSQSIPSGSFHKPFSLLHQGRQSGNHNHRKLTNLNHMGPQPCLTQWNYEPCHVGPPKTDRSCWRVLTKCDPLEKEWQTTSVFLPWEPHEWYEKAKR